MENEKRNIRKEKALKVWRVVGPIMLVFGCFFAAPIVIMLAILTYDRRYLWYRRWH